MSAIETQIQQMVTDDPQGKEAESLLPYLLVFTGLFDGSALVAVVGGETVTGPSRLLKVLKAWGFIEQPNKDHYVLTSSALRDIIDTPPHLYERHFEYYRTRHMRVYPDRYERISVAWPNIAAALKWGFAHQPQNAVEWMLALLPYMAHHVPFPEQKDLVQRAFQSTGDHSVFNRAQLIKAAGDMAFFEDDFTTAQQRYGEALDLYDTLPRNWSMHTDDDPVFYTYLEACRPDSAVADEYKRIHSYPTPRDIFHLFTIYDAIIAAVRQGDMIAVMRLSMRALEFYQFVDRYDERGNDDNAFFRLFMQWALHTQQPELIRYFYGHQIERTRWSALWDWGRYEYSIGQTRDGYMLCRLALNDIEGYVLDISEEIDRVHEATALSWAQTLSCMTCEDC